MTELPLEYRGNFLIVNGNRNIAHYDFSTSAARENVLDIMATNTYLLLSADGLNVVSNKSLKNQQYIFNIPHNQEIFQKIRQKKEFMASLRHILVPEGFIAGFHINHKDGQIKVMPVIGRKEYTKNAECLGKMGVESTFSDITKIGLSDGFGRITHLLESQFD